MPAIGGALRLFVSFSRRDARLKDQFLEHLAPLQHLGRIELWSEDRVQPGADWQQAMGQALAAADVALLLVSPTYLASPLAQATEAPAIFARQARADLRVILILLRSCAWEEHPQFQSLQVLPRDGRAIGSHQGERPVGAGRGALARSPWARR